MEPKVEYSSRLEEILAEWDLDQEKSYETATSVILPSTDDTVTVSTSQTSPYTYTGGLNLGAFPNTIYTTGTSTTAAPWSTFNPNTASTKISLSGDNADIEVNGWSLVDAVKRIEERLGLFQPNPKLEKEWEELRELGEQYRKLEQYIKDKQATWDKLKAMPAPELD
jgi:hypothetical protein